MEKKIQQNDRLKRAIIFSAALHILLMVFLIWVSLEREVTMGGDGAQGSVMDAVMVDPKAALQQYNRQQQQQIDIERAEEQRQKKASRQAEELQQKQLAEQERLRELEKERLQAELSIEEAQQKAALQQKHLAEQEKQAQAMAAKAREEQKQAEVAMIAARKKQREAEIKQAQAEIKQKKAEENSLQKAEKEAKKKAKVAPETSSDAAKQASDVDDLFGNLVSSGQTPQSGANTAGADKENGKKSGASKAEINSYLAQIKTAIEANFHDATLFSGRICDLRIKLAPDGRVLDVTAEGGDPALCKAAVVAAKQARIPKPPNQELYDMFKNAPLVFKPQ